ncbi:HET-domain-containing protein [Xylaria digitata]|nr:HET-domain-containing protein [Xylaria digitata]
MRFPGEMQQELHYSPLAPHEIRVIRLFTEADHPAHATGPVHCEILHVPLNDSHLVGRPKDVAEESSGTWPVTADDAVGHPNPSQSLAFDQLFKRGPLERCSPFARIPEWPRLRAPKCLRRKKAEPGAARWRADQDAKDARPWRYTWGDFVALSYVWGDPSLKREVFVDGIPVLVTASLEAALQELRNHVRIQQGFLIWADALCINQEDLDERAAQVARMRDIYHAAWQVVIWLGPEQHRSDLAILALRYMSLQLQQKGEMAIFYRRVQVFVVRLPFWQWKHTHTALNIQKDALEAIYHFLARPYWRRLWIIQEVALGAANSPVLCGNSSIRLKDVFNALQFMKGDGAALGQYIVMCARGRSKIAKRWDDAAKDTYNISEKLWERPLAIASLQVANDEISTTKSGIYDVLLLVSEANASDERDRVYGVLGLPQLAHKVRLVPDYNRTVSETFTLFSANLYLSRNLNGLRLVNSPVSAQGTRYWKSTHFSRPRAPKFVHRHRVVHPGCKHDLPSWVICWSCPRNPAEPLNSARSAPTLPFTTNPPSISGNILTVRGVIFDTITTLSAFHATESDKSYPWNSSDPPISPYGSHDATREALARTLTGNAGGGEDAGLDPSYAILNWKLWITGIQGLDNNLFGLKDFYYRNKALQLFRAWSLESLIHPPKSTTHTTPRIPYITATHREALSRVMRLLRWRRLVTTRSGYLGLVPAATRAGDVIVLVPGCDTPLVLRVITDTKGEAKFSVVGEAHIHWVTEHEMDMRLMQEGDTIASISIC